jgi:hypothetical protein
MTTDANQITHESLTSKSFRAPSTIDERHRVEISGYGVRLTALSPGSDVELEACG